ncbi:hypothetical protein M9Y10_011113 [Tritrichomonas musculus]|uniref:Dienelactone hydrolase domain-containing protein n=1 Tax=Tritrichomonas musculus TaxID=1915356 RepID=A0ABR2IMR7_9EUKA
MKKDKDKKTDTNLFPESNNPDPLVNNMILSNINDQNNQTNVSVPLTNIYRPINPQQSPNTDFFSPNQDASVFNKNDLPATLPSSEPVNPPAEDMPHEMPSSLQSDKDIKKARRYIWLEYKNQLKMDPVRLKEVKEFSMKYGEVTMKYGIHIIGQPLESGYPLFIALHGGGQSDTPDMNNSQWTQMGKYYVQGVASGVYLYPRGIRDTWDTHFNPESYPLYDRLITNMIAFNNVDPNRIYLMGYSAGGDGVYAIVARMPDRFAAANMSAGHPNSVPLWNIYNMPFIIQAGENDSAYERNVVTAKYDKLLKSYQDELNGGYSHKCFIHAGKGHNFRDNSNEPQKVFEKADSWLNKKESKVVEVDTNAIRLIERYVRNPFPRRIVWDLAMRACQRDVESFYWIRADKNISKGRIVASFDKDSNSIDVEQCTVNGEIAFLLSNEMLNLFEPVTVYTPNGRHVFDVTPDFDLLFETTVERGDYNYQFAAKIVMKF